jgi:hypothetical protein
MVGWVVWLKDDGWLCCPKRGVCVFWGDGLSFGSVVLMKESLATLNLLSIHYHVLSRCG